MDSWAAALRILHRLVLLITTLLFGGPPRRSQRLETAHAVLEAYSSLSVSRILAPLDDVRFTQQVLPKSLGMPRRNKQDFSKHANGITSIFTEFRMEPQQVYEDEARNAVVVYARMTGKLVRDLGRWENECVIFMTFNREGTKVVSHQEFVDSAKAKMMKDKLAPKDFGVK